MERKRLLMMGLICTGMGLILSSESVFAAGLYEPNSVKNQTSKTGDTKISDKNPFSNNEALMNYDLGTTQEKVDQTFADLKESDKLTLLPGGGFLHGKAKRTESNDSHKIIASYDSETDPNAIPLIDAKKLMTKQINEDIIAQKTQINKGYLSPRGGTPPNINSQYFLAGGQVYNSQKFSNNGWQYAGYWFINEYKASSGQTLFGGPLDFQTHVDSGAVGDHIDVDHIYIDGWASAGLIIYPNTGYQRVISYDSSRPELTYYTYQALPGTTYSAKGTGVPR